jgi:hypothetical protein
MIRRVLGAVTTLVAWAAAPGQVDADSLAHRHWFEARTSYFHLNSC